MPPSPFQYAIVRVVPQVERGECLNAGVVLFCRPLRFLAARVELDEERLRALAPDADVDAVRGHLDALVRVADGDPGAGADGRAARVGALPLARRPVEHDHPVLPRAHGPERGPRGRARAVARAAGALTRGRIRSCTSRPERTPLPRYLLALLIGLLALTGAACGSDDDEEPAAEATAASTAQAADACAPDQLALVSSGTLTVGTDKPAYPPYFEDDDPANGKGFESAVAYAIADKLGLADNVKWTGRAVQLLLCARPEEVRLRHQPDLDHAEAGRARRLLRAYYTAPQAVLALKSSPAASASSLADLADAKLGVQVGTTSLDAVNEVIKPSSQPQVFNDSNDTVRALKAKRVDAIVVDLPTAFYLTAARSPRRRSPASSTRRAATTGASCSPRTPS